MVEERGHARLASIFNEEVFGSGRVVVGGA
jgi:hypothetical protein